MKNPVSAPGPPPLLKKSWIRACIRIHQHRGTLNIYINLNIRSVSYIDHIMLSYIQDLCRTYGLVLHSTIIYILHIYLDKVSTVRGQIRDNSRSSAATWRR